MQSLLNSKSHQEIQVRIAKLSPDSKPKWGKMSAGQMLKHCQRPLEIAVYQKDFDLKPNILVKLFFKKAMYNDKPFMKNMPTPKGFAVSDDVDFNTEKESLLKLINAFYQLKDQGEWKSHPVFGKLSSQEWGQMQYKHLDHHLKQFGV